MINEIHSQLRRMPDNKLSETYKALTGSEAPIEKPPEPKITLSDDRVLAFAPAGSLRKQQNGEEESLRKGLLQLMSKKRKKVLAKPISFYQKNDQDALRIGMSSFSKEHFLKALSVLGKPSYLHPPLKDEPLVIENENGDMIFIAPRIETI